MCINIIKLYISVVISCFNNFTNTNKKKRGKKDKIYLFICVYLYFLGTMQYFWPILYTEY